MASAIGIATAVNQTTGNTCYVTLSGTPVGTLQIKASEVPGAPEFGCPFIVSGSGYIVTLPYGNTLWYLWAVDGNGLGAQSAAVFVGLNNDADVDRVGQFIRQTLEDNKAGLEAMARQWYPGTTVKAFHYGFPPSVIQWPSVVITNPRADWEWFCLPYTQQWTYSFSIAFLAQRSEEETETPLATRLMEATMIVLNRRRYMDFNLNGLELFNCMTRQGNVTEIEAADNVFVTTASLVWSGKALKFVGSGSPG